MGPPLSLSPSLQTDLPPPLESGMRYQKEKEIEVIFHKPMHHPTPSPTTGQIPEFSELQLKNLESAISYFENLEGLVGSLFGKNPPTFKELPSYLRRSARRMVEYYLLKSFEAIDPTSKRHPLKEDKEYLSKLNIYLGSLDDLRNIRNRIRSDFLAIKSEPIFKIAIELVKRNPSTILKNLKETKLPTQTNTLKRVLGKSWDESKVKPKIKAIMRLPPSIERDDLLISWMGREFEIIAFSFKACEDFTTFCMTNKSLPSIKKSLSNIQKLYTYLTRERKRVIRENLSFQTVMKMGKKVAHLMPENLIVAMDEEISREDIYDLMIKDPLFFKNMFSLIGYDDSFNNKTFRKKQMLLIENNLKL